MLRTSLDTALTHGCPRADARRSTWLRGLLVRLGHGAARAWLSLERRRQRKAMLHLDDRLLRDIGLTRADVRLECAKPIWRQ